MFKTIAFLLLSFNLYAGQYDQYIGVYKLKKQSSRGECYKTINVSTEKGTINDDYPMVKLNEGTQSVVSFFHVGEKYINKGERLSDSYRNNDRKVYRKEYETVTKDDNLLTHEERNEFFEPYSGFKLGEKSIRSEVIFEEDGLVYSKETEDESKLCLYKRK